MEPLTIKPREVHDGHETHGHDGCESGGRDAAPAERQESFLVEVFKFAILALVIVLPFRWFVAQPFIVSGASMDPTFETGEYLIVDQVSYRLHPPERGDVVIFKFPGDPSKYFIKRIIGVPGEVVKLANGYTTIIDPATGEEMQLNEPYLMTDRTDDHLTITLSGNEYFVMGDNRSKSSDSRVWGPVPRENIVGRAYVRLLPPSHFELLPGEYTYDMQDPSLFE